MKEVCGIALDPPVMNAAGTLSCECMEPADIDRFGAIVTNTVTPEPREGNPHPHWIDVPRGRINSVGLANPGIAKFLKELDKWDVGKPVIASFTALSRAMLRLMAQLLAEEERVAAVELNLSCPNVPAYYIEHVGEWVGEAVDAIEGSKPVIAKLGVNGVVECARLAEDSNADAVTVVNSVPALAWIAGRKEPYLGGYSGPSVKPVALRAVYEVSQAVGIPVIGCGGASHADDVAEFVRAGACAVQMGSGRLAGVED